MTIVKIALDSVEQSFRIEYDAAAIVGRTISPPLAQLICFLGERKCEYVFWLVAIESLWLACDSFYVIFVFDVNWEFGGNFGILNDVSN